MKDVLIIGSGAGGAPLALSLSQAGFDVLVLEKGPRHGRADYRHDELLEAVHPGFFVPTRREDPHVLRRHGAPPGITERTALGWIACCVGGGTAHMGGAFYRFHADDFRLRTRLGPFESVADWPYGYADLEPYYARAEWEVGISGGAVPSAYEGFRSRPLPLPPLDCHPLVHWFDTACNRLGVEAFDTPRAINSRPYGGRPACTGCDFCAGFGCPTGARGSTQEALLPRAEATGRCEVRPDTMVKEVTIDLRGRATGCVHLDAAGREHVVKARVVCVCCSAVESARLLLVSRSAAFPNGLANGSGLVGRHLQFHAGSAGRARFRYDRHPEKSLRDSNHFLGRSVADYYFLPPSVAPFGKGGLLRFDLERHHPVATAHWLAQDSPGRYAWGEALRQRISTYFNEFRDVEFEVFHDFIPNDDTLAALDPEVTDRWGLPAARIHLREPDHHRVAGTWVRDRGLEILDAMGACEVVARDAGYTSGVMAHGTCRAGRDPATSVLDEFCRSHEVPNLFVVDGSFMPTSGGAPSTLTIMANAFRTAEFIADRARTGELA